MAWLNRLGLTGARRFVAEPVDIDELKARLVEHARSLGFATVGFAPAADDPLRAGRLREWLAAGMHGEMEWMEARAEVRQGPQAMWPEARSVIALGMGDDVGREDDGRALARQLANQGLELALVDRI
jgi:epoxyqueuosine reductase QueG